MTIFVDTSALIAVLDADDRHHVKASAAWRNMVGVGERLVIGNYVIVETIALLQHRFGINAVRIFCDDMLPVLTVDWADETVHRAGLSAVLTAGQRGLSLVDCVSFELMRRRAISTAFSVDRHFREQGFHCIP